MTFMKSFSLTGVFVIKGVLLDIDGTFLDSNDAHAQSWVTSLQKFGYDVSFAQMRKLIGMGSDKILPLITRLKPESEVAKKISAQRDEIFKSQYLKDLKAFSGTRELIIEIIKHKLKICVATSAGKDDLHLLLRQAKIDDLVIDAVNSDDVENSKPSPDIVSAALAKINLISQEAIMIGDTPYDIQAAAKASVKTIAFRCGGGWSDADLASAVAIYDGPADLLAQFDSSILA